MKKVFSYYEPSQDTKREAMVHILYETNYPAHFHRKIEITYVLQGSVKALINGIEYVASQDDILFAPSYIVHSYQTSKDVIRLLFLPHHEMAKDFTDYMKSRNFVSLFFSDKKYNREVLLPLLYELMELPSGANELVYKGLVNLILGKMLEHYPITPSAKNNNKKIETLINIFTYIEENLAGKLSLDLLAGKFGYNKFYLSKLFNKYTGTTLQDYINGLRIMNFLNTFQKGGASNITQAALNAGFNSMPSFYRAFKKVLNCSPKEYYGE